MARARGHDRLRRPRAIRTVRCSSTACSIQTFWVWVVVVCGTSPAADPSPSTLAYFTQRVQPLMLNACAAGACHGGRDAPAPRLERAAGGSVVDRRITLVNLRSLLDAVGPQRDPQPLVSLLSRRHPASGGTRALTARPLSNQQRTALETWLEMVRADEAIGRPDTAVRLASGAEPSRGPTPPNRLQALLESAANPPSLPPPERPRGLIFGPVEPADEP